MPAPAQASAAAGAPRASSAANGRTSPWDARKDRVLTEMHASGVVFSQIAVVLQMSRSAVIARARRLRLPGREPSPAIAGARSLIDAITEAERARISELWALGLSSQRIAERIGAPLTRQRVAYLADKWGLVRDARAVPPRQAPRPQARAFLWDEAPEEARVRAAPLPRLPAPSVVPAAVAERGCRWPLWSDTERATHVYCGAPVVPGKQPYCAKCRAIGTVPRYADAA
jgi:hypothetical protein